MKTCLVVLLVTLNCTLLAQDTDKILTRRLNDLVSSFKGNVGVYVKHLKTGKTVAINADSVFPTASMIKIPITIGVFDKIEKGELKYDSALTYYDSLLQPGGHADGEENVLNVALREAEEETGVKKFQLLQERIFDLDIHPIPARAGFPEHLHYDIRFLFEADKNEKVIVSDESHDVAWIHIDKLDELTNNNPSIMRMVRKGA